MPAGFDNRGLTTSQLISLIAGDMTAPAPATVGPTTANQPNPELWFAGLVALYA